MKKQFTAIKTIKHADRFNIFEKRYCSDCTKYNLKTGYCDILNQKIRCPDESRCSWFIRKWEAS
jgi:hypothetical protein